MEKQIVQTNDVETILTNLNLKIGPGFDRERTLKAIDGAVARIETILRDMAEAERAERNMTAFERFMHSLRATLEQAGPLLSVRSNVSWIKIESRVNGHKIYVSKGKVAVGRVDSTLPAELVPGAKRAETYNGRIASWIPADVERVKNAIDLLVDDRMEPLKP